MAPLYVELVQLLSHFHLKRNEDGLSSGGSGLSSDLRKFPLLVDLGNLLLRTRESVYVLVIDSLCLLVRFLLDGRGELQFQFQCHASSQDTGF